MDQAALSVPILSMWIELTADYKQMPGRLATLLPALTRCFQGLLCLAFHSIGTKYFPVDFYWTAKFATYKTFPYR